MLIAVALLAVALAVVIKNRELLCFAKQNLPVSAYAQLGSGSPSRPFCYVQIGGRTLRLASSPTALRTAAPIAASKTEVFRAGCPGNWEDVEQWHFPTVSLPNTPPGILSAEAEFTYTRYLLVNGSPFRPDRAAITADVRATARDRAGRPWVYAFNTGAYADHALGRARVTDFPSATDLQRPAVCLVGMGKSGEGFVLTAEAELPSRGSYRSVEISQVNGKPAQVEYEIRDAGGKLVHRALALLERQLSPGSGTYRVPLNTPGRYQVTATLRGPVLRTPARSQYLLNLVDAPEGRYLDVVSASRGHAGTSPSRRGP